MRIVCGMPQHARLAAYCANMHACERGLPTYASLFDKNAYCCYSPCMFHYGVLWAVTSIWTRYFIIPCSRLLCDECSVFDVVRLRHKMVKTPDLNVQRKGRGTN